VPSKRGFFIRKMWKMTPAEKISHWGSTCTFSVNETISGATYPGVPHL
jgi:hypothetical protein